MSSILDHALISERYFFPRRQPLANPLQVEVSGATLACYSSIPNPGAPTLLHFHGNGEIVADYLPDFAQALCSLDLNVFFAEYRGYGGSSGSPSLVKMLADVVPILEAVGAPPERVIVYGRSVGSIYALELIRQRPEIAGLVLESGIADPLERVLLRVTPEELGAKPEEVQAEAKLRLDHKGKLATYRNPTLVLHTRHDHLVHFSHAERLADWAAGPCELVVFEQGDHNSIHAFNGPQLLHAVRRLLKLVFPQEAS